MYCPECDKENNDDAKFCQYCGFDISNIDIENKKKLLIVEEIENTHINQDSLGSIAQSKFEEEANEICEELNIFLETKSYVIFGVDDFFVVLPSWDGVDTARSLVKNIIENIYKKNPQKKVTCWEIPPHKELEMYPVITKCKSYDHACWISDILYYYMDLVTFVVLSRINGELYNEIVIDPKYTVEECFEICRKYWANMDEWNKNINSVMINYKKIKSPIRKISMTEITNSKERIN